MATPEINKFQTYKFDTVQEERASRILSEGNIQNIRNEMVSAINEKLLLEFDATNPQRFIQQEASLAGQIKAFQFLLDLHEDTVSALSTLDHD